MFEGELQKCCCRCGEAKLASEFNFKNRASDRRHPFCRECQHAWNREHYQRNKAIYIARAKRQNRAYYAANVQRLFDYLLDHPCVDCGETDIVVLHFDHRNPADKVIDVGTLMSRSSWAQILAEIAKCDVRCANCHQRRTASQFGWRKLALWNLTGRGGRARTCKTSRFGDERSTN
jgi:hypothetical protein